MWKKAIDTLCRKCMSSVLHALSSESATDTPQEKGLEIDKNVRKYPIQASTLLSSETVTWELCLNSTGTVSKCQAVSNTMETQTDLD